MSENKGRCVIYGFHIIAGSVDIRVAYDLDVCLGCAGHFGNQRGNVLVQIGSEHCLDYENVVVALDRLEHTEVIDVAVTVQVKV